MIPEDAISREDTVGEHEVQEAVRQYKLFAQTQPNAYCQQILGVTPWSKQRAIMEACADPSISQVAVRSGNGVGKTYLAASIIAQ